MILIDWELIASRSFFGGTNTVSVLEQSPLQKTLSSQILPSLDLFRPTALSSAIYYLSFGLKGHPAFASQQRVEAPVAATLRGHVQEDEAE